MRVGNGAINGMKVTKAQLLFHGPLTLHYSPAKSARPFDTWVT